MTFRLPAACVLPLFACVVAANSASAQISVGYPGKYPGGRYDLSSSVRVQVTPRDTQVFVDGYYAGKADDFDGVFQRLRVEPGQHEIQLFLPGHRLDTQKVYLQPGNTFRIQHTMEKLDAGEPEPERPTGDPRPQRAAPRDQPDAAGAPRAPGDRDRTAPASPQSGYGTLSLQVQPGDAQVTIDGQRWDVGGTDTAIVVQLAAGPHTIEIRKSGYRGYVTEITIRGGDTLPLKVDLAPER